MIKIKKETIVMIRDWEATRKRYGLNIRDARLIGKIKKMRGLKYGSNSI